MNYQENLHKIRQNLFLKRFTNELEYLEKNDLQGEENWYLDHHIYIMSTITPMAATKEVIALVLEPI